MDDARLTHGDRRRVLSLAFLLSLVAVLASAAVIGTLYRSGLEHRRETLTGIAAGQANLVAHLERQQERLTGDAAPRALAAAIAELGLDRRRYSELGESGEVVFSWWGEGGLERVRLQGGRRFDGESFPQRMPTVAGPGDPMAEALRGRSGTLVGRDYRNQEVLAAFVPVPELGAGVVAKMDLAEVRAPLLEAVATAIFATALLVGGGLLLFLRTLNPVLRRVEASEAHLRGVIDAAAEGIVTADAKGRVVGFNPAAERMFGRGAESVAGCAMAALFEPAENGEDPLRACIDDAGAGDDPGRRIECFARRGDGSRFPVQVAVSRTRTRDGRVLVIAVVDDITERRAAEEALREGKAQLERQVAERTRELAGILDNVQDLVFRCDLEGRASWVSASSEWLVGLPAPALVGRSADEALLGPGGYARLRAALDAGGGRVHDFEVALPAEEGGERRLAANCQYLRDDEGTCFGIEGVLRDVSAYHAFQARIETLNRLYSVLSHANRATVRFRDKQRFYAELCRIVVETGGLRMAWIGELDAAGNHVLPVEHAGFESGYMDLVRIPLNESARGRGPVATSVKANRVTLCNDIAEDERMRPWRDAALARGYRAIGTFPFRCGGQPVGSLNVYADHPGYFNDENVQLLTGLADDISHALDVQQKEQERTRVMEELRSAGQKLTSHVERTPLAVIEFDADFCVRAWNPAAEGIFGYTAAEAVGRHGGFLVWPEHGERVAAEVERLKSGRPGSKLVNDNVTRDGRRITCEWYNTALADADGRMSGIMCLAHDVTAVRRYQAQLSALNTELEQRVRVRTHELQAVNHELEAFAYSVSHDLRAPLRSIDGFSDLLLRRYNDALDATGQDFLRRVRAAAQRMGRLIDDLLRLSRVMRREPTFGPVDLSAEAAEVVQALREAEPQRRVEVSIAPGLTVRGDRPLLRVVLDNLLGNAWKFTGQQGQARIEFDVREEAGEQIFRVSDNGAGFDMDYVDKLFTPFQRLHGNEEFDGTGIGLATVQRVVARHGGRVWAEGRPGEGARFYFTLGHNAPAEAKVEDEKQTADSAG